MWGPEPPDYGSLVFRVRCKAGLVHFLAADAGFGEFEFEFVFSLFGFGSITKIGTWRASFVRESQGCDLFRRERLII